MYGKKPYEAQEATVGYPVDYGHLWGSVNQSVDFEAGLCAAEESSSKDGHIEVDGDEINSVETSVVFEILGEPPLLS